MPLVVTSAAGINGDGYGALLVFGTDGSPRGVFSQDARISDPRGLAFDQNEGLLFINSGADRVLALDAKGRVVRDTGPIAGSTPAAATSRPTADLSWECGQRGASWRLQQASIGPDNAFCRRVLCPFRVVSHS